jgi:UDP-N-acetylmuramoyl-L-alanyl-D-glutamate--2,6-diaminopimelate ligase
MYQDHPLQILKNTIHLFQATISNIYYGFPSRKLKILSVTGTDGKTTTTLMLYEVLKKSGIKVGYLSTIGAKIGDKDLDTGLHVTTPDPWMVPKYLKMMKDQGIEYVVLEATSNGLQQNRLWGIKFSGGIITNIKSDHLDYHKTWENYAEAKFKMVEQLKPNSTLVLNQDDREAYKWLTDRINTRSLDINIESIGERGAKNIKYSLNGIDFDYQDQKFHLNLIGLFNLQNALGVISLASKFVKLPEISRALATFKAPKGRMEVIQTEPFTIIIDFAHTPNSLEKALTSINELRNKEQKLIVLFGCAGKRDKERRRMGEIASKNGDIIILTAEDPREEKLKDINDSILEYSQKAKGELVSRIPNNENYVKVNIDEIKNKLSQVLAKSMKPIVAFDEDSVQSRRDAISFALKIANKGDIVYLTGKAHEQSLAFGAQEREYPWSEHEEVERLLEMLNN